jgi:pyruvate formate lyase activating enzyme
MTPVDMISRRRFLSTVALGAAAVCHGRRAQAQGSDPEAIALGPDAPPAPHLARWWRESSGKQIECELCPRNCRVAEGARGACGVRENRGGKYFTLVHSRPCTAHVDPVEKKPFYHVLPGKTAFSLAAPGCNLECKFCQNWEISQARPEQIHTFDSRPEDIVRLARERATPAIACTYSEPTVWSEYVYDIAAAAKTAGIRSLMVSNGFIEEQPIKDLSSVLSAVKIDLKGFTEKFYREQCSGRLAPVLDTLRRLGKTKVWLEIVVLVIPGLNDDENNLRDMARFVHNEVGANVPLHFTRFHPAYRMMNVPSTPVKTLERARQTALAEGLNFVYVGNVLGHPGNHTYCPGCKAIVVKRSGLSLLENRLKAGKCPGCGRTIPGLWT